MFVITLSDIIGLVIFAVILVVCTIYWVVSKNTVAKYDREYHAPKTDKPASKSPTDELNERLAKLRTSNPELYRKIRRKQISSYLLVAVIVIGICLFAAWIKK